MVPAEEGLEWCCLVQCAVGPMVVVTSHVLDQRIFEVAAVDDQYLTESSRRTAPIQCSAIASAQGACTGGRIRMPSLASMASQTAVNLMSRSGSRQRGLSPLSTFSASWRTQQPTRLCPVV